MIDIRIAEKRDTESILAIYKPFITDTPVSFEEIVPSTDEFWKRIQNITNDYPWLVCEIDNCITGYAYASNHRDRSSYRWTKEVSVYIHSEYRKYGIANCLYTSLIEILKIQGVMNVLAGISLPNDTSVLFHEKFGFRKAGIYSKIGYKLNKWHDVGWWEFNIHNQLTEPLKKLKKLSEVADTENWKLAINTGLSKIKIVLASPNSSCKLTTNLL